MGGGRKNGRQPEGREQKMKEGREDVEGEESIRKGTWRGARGKVQVVFKMAM